MLKKKTTIRSRPIKWPNQTRRKQINKTKHGLNSVRSLEKTQWLEDSCSDLKCGVMATPSFQASEQKAEVNNWCANCESNCKFNYGMVAKRWGKRFENKIQDEKDEQERQSHRLQPTMTTIAGLDWKRGRWLRLTFDKNQANKTNQRIKKFNKPKFNSLVLSNGQTKVNTQQK